MGGVEAFKADSGSERFWTFALVEERLVEAMRLWWRSPGGGSSPFAADGPWELITERTRAEAGGGYIGRGEVEQVALRRLPLTRGEVAARDAASAMLEMVEGDEDRRLVVLVLCQLARGAKRVDWAPVKRAFGARRGAGALAERYARAIGFVAFRMNGVPLRQARALSRRQGTGWEEVMPRKGQDLAARDGAA